MSVKLKPSIRKKKDNLQNLLGRVYDRFVKIKYQQSVKEKVAVQKARLVKAKEKVKKKIRGERKEK